MLPLLSGCGGKIPNTNYYLLHLPDPPARSAEPLPKTAVLMPFDASEMLTQDRIVYRPTREEVGFYEYHRWAEDPRTTVTNAFLNHLRRLNTFSQVVPFDARAKGDYIIRGRIERLEEVDFEQGVTVHVRLSAEVVEANTQEAVWQGTEEGAGEVTVGEVRDVVRQMSAATQASLQKLASSLDQHLRSGGSRRAAASSQSQASGPK